MVVDHKMEVDGQLLNSFEQNIFVEYMISRNRIINVVTNVEHLISYNDM